MANIGEPLKEIEIEPLVEPFEIPVPVTTPVEPEKVPA